MSLVNLELPDPASYEPNAQVMERISERSIVLLVGPVAVGKSTIIDFMDKWTVDAGYVRSLTTRQMRVGETNRDYDFYKTTDDLKRLEEQIAEGELMQYAVHPETGDVYGSTIGDDDPKLLLVDCLYSAVEDIRALPYEQVSIASVITKSSQWKRRLMRRSFDEATLLARMREAIDSLEWSKDPDNNSQWIINEDQRVQESANRVIDIARGNPQPADYAGVKVHSMIDFAQKVLEDPSLLSEDQTLL